MNNTDNNHNSSIMDLNTEKKYILGLGNPIIDLIADVSHEFLEKYSLILNSATIANQFQQNNLFSELKKSHQTKYKLGGSCLNTIRLCQSLLKSPNSTAFVGCIGNDDDSEWLQEMLKKENLQSFLSRSEKQNDTGICAVLVTSDKHRTLCTSLFAANDYSFKSFEKNKTRILEYIDNCKIVYSTGFFLMVAPEVIKTIGDYCTETNKIFCLNLSADFISQMYFQEFCRALENSDFVFGNEDEYLSFGKVAKFDTDDLEIIAEKMVNFKNQNRNRDRIVVITRGSKSIVVAKKWNNTKVLITKYPTENIDYDKITDFNGVGDAFVSGFLYNLCFNDNIDDCIRSAIKCAMHVMQRVGFEFDKTLLNELE